MIPRFEDLAKRKIETDILERTPEKAIECCIENCSGPENCKIHGWIWHTTGWIPCEIYQGWKQNYIAQKQIEAAVPSGLTECSFEKFDAKTESQKSALETAKRYMAKEVWNQGKGIIYFGHYGVGKSHLAISIYRELLKKNINAIFARPKTSGGFQAIEEYYEELQKPDILIYDDLGMETTKDFIIPMLFQLFDYRYINKKSTIITTNLHEKEMKKFLGERIISRLRSKNAFIEIKGEDYRETHKEVF